MTYNFIRIRTREIKTVDEHNCVHSLIKGFTVEHIDSINANSDAEAIKMVEKDYQAVLGSYELEEDYLEWMKKNMSEDGKTIFVSLFKLAEEGEVIDWHYNG